MNPCRATETLGTGSKTKTMKTTTTLYDLLNDLNMKFFGPEWEHITEIGKGPVEDGRYSLAAEKVDKMFASGQLKFKNPQTIKRYFIEMSL
jgi:hypothetical protein